MSNERLIKMLEGQEKFLVDLSNDYTMCSKTISELVEEYKRLFDRVSVLERENRMLRIDLELLKLDK